MDDLGFGADPTAKLASGHIFSPMVGELHTRYIRLFESVKAEAGM